MMIIIIIATIWLLIVSRHTLYIPLVYLVDTFHWGIHRWLYFYKFLSPPTVSGLNFMAFFRCRIITHTEENKALPSCITLQSETFKHILARTAHCRHGGSCDTVQSRVKDSFSLMLSPIPPPPQDSSVPVKLAPKVTSASIHLSSLLYQKSK